MKGVFVISKMKVHVYTERDEKEAVLELPMKETQILRSLYEAGIATSSIHEVWLENTYLCDLIDQNEPCNLDLLNAIAYGHMKMSEEDELHLDAVERFLSPKNLREYLAIVLHHNEFIIDDMMTVEGLEKEPAKSKLSKFVELEEFTELNKYMVTPIVVTLSLNSEPYRLPLPLTEDMMYIFSLHKINEIECIVPFIDPYLHDCDLEQLNQLSYLLMSLNEDQIINFHHHLHRNSYELLQDTIQNLEVR